MQQAQIPKEMQSLKSLNYTTPSQIGEAIQGMASITKVLLEVSKYLTTLKREFRGEAIYQDEENGQTFWIQVSKPIFVKIDPQTKEPLKEKVKMPWGEEKMIYVPNDDAIEELLSILKFSGVNQISPIGFNTENNYLDDLKEFECKLASILCLKQKSWGLDKELLPMYQFKIKTLIQDVRSMSIKGNTLKAIITSVQRIEKTVEGDYKKKKEMDSPYK